MGILSWVIFGLIAGALAKWIMPGDDPGGCLITSGLGIVGAFVGGMIATQMGWGKVSGFDLKSFGVAILGSVVLLFVYRQMKKR